MFQPLPLPLPLPLPVHELLFQKQDLHDAHHELINSNVNKAVLVFSFLTEFQFKVLVIHFSSTTHWVSILVQSICDLKLFVAATIVNSKYNTIVNTAKVWKCIQGGETEFGNQKRNRNYPNAKWIRNNNNKQRKQK